MSDALTVPVAPQYLVDDVTPEKLADLLGEHGERMGVLSAEGGIFQVIAGRYSEGRADGLDLFLKGHSGDYLPIDRIGRTDQAPRGTGASPWSSRRNRRFSPVSPATLAFVVADCSLASPTPSRSAPLVVGRSPRRRSRPAVRERYET